VGVLLVVLVGTGVGGGLKHLLVAGDEADVLLTSPTPDAVDDRPAGVRTELVAAGVVEPVQRPDQRDVPIADPLGQVVPGPDVLLRSRDDQPLVRLDDPVPDRDRLGQQPLDLVELGRGGAGRVDPVAEPAGKGLQVVLLTEQVSLLLPGEE
jgi:hypothetical protein